MDLTNRFSQFSKIWEHYQKIITPGDAFTTEIHLLKRFEGTFKRFMENFNNSDLDELRSLLIAILKQGLKVSTDVYVEHFLEIHDDAGSCSSDLLTDVMTLFFMINKSYFKDLQKILLDIKINNRNCVNQKLQVVDILTNLILESDEKYEENSAIFTVDLCIEILLQTHIKQSRTSLIIIIQNLVNHFKYHEFIIKLWNHMKPGNELDEINAESIDLMCIFSDIYLIQNSSIFHRITQDFSYWKFLQNGLSSPDFSIRKKSIYLLKKTIDVIFLNKMKIAACNASETIFYWNCDENDKLNNMWTNYFIIMDSLDEKQSHLIIPTLKLMLSLNEMHSSWMDILIVKIMRHDTDAVKSYGISHALKNLKLKNNQHRCENIILHILEALNDTKIYPERRNEHEDVLIAMTSFFCEHEEYVIKNISKIEWAPVPLFYITYCLKESSHNKSFDTIELDICNIVQLVRICRKSPSIYIRSAMQINIIKYYINRISPRDIRHLPTILGEFNESESINRGTKIWSCITNWMKNLDLEKKDILSILENNFKPTKYTIKQIARFLIFCCDANVIAHDEVVNILKSNLCYFNNCENRCYASRDVQHEALDMANTILTEIKTLTKINNDATRNLIINIVSRHAKDMMNYIKIQIDLCDNCNTEIFDKCLALSQNLLTEDIVKNELIDNIELLTEHCLASLSVENNCMKHYFSFSLLAYFIKYYYVPNTNSVINEQRALRNKLYINRIGKSGIEIMEAFNTFPRRNKERDVSQGKLASLMHRHYCTVLCAYIKFRDLSNDDAKIMNNITNIMEHGANDIVLDVLLVLQALFRETKNFELPIKAVIDRCWVESLNLKRSNLFLPCMQVFIDVLLQQAVFRNIDFLHIAREYCNKIFELGKSIVGLANILMKKVYEICICNVDFEFSPIIIEGLLFGNISRRDQRIESQTCHFIEADGDVELTYHNADADLEVRALSIAAYLKILRYNTIGTITKNEISSSKAILQEVTNFLIQKCTAEDKKKTRHFSDSKHHRFKQRVLQTLLVSQPFWNDEQNQKVLHWANNSLMQDIHQPSVKYLLEWLVALIIIRDTALCKYLWESMEKVVDIRIGAMSSFITITYLIIKQLTKQSHEEAMDVIKTSISKIIPWTMGQHFNLRLYAQVVLKKLIHIAKPYCIELNILQESLSTILSHGNASKFVKKIEDDLFLTQFDVFEHFSMETIFYDLPYLTYYTCEDIIHPEVFSKLCNSEEFTIPNMMPFLNKTTKLKGVEMSSWGIQDPNNSKFDLESENNEIFDNVQQKITPWRTMDISTNDIVEEKNMAKKGLIVVASLIDLAPNLGGLARTCEVFGVEEYVIDNLQRVKDKQFQSLSMSSEKWLGISEIKPWEINQYIIQKRSEGYSIVGAEQTAKSQTILNTKFPKKCVLLLGNEKEGVPANLLPLLDECIEIPQNGLIRSLNVHVTGALFIWEYAKQHLLPNE